MLLHCNGKKCNTTREHKLKADTNEVMCLDCEEPNNAVSEFMKNAMKSSGDLYRTTQKKSFMYKCSKCTIDRPAKIIDEQAVCASCHTPLNLSTPMLEVLKTMIPVSNAGTEADTLSKGVVKRKKG